MIKQQLLFLLLGFSFIAYAQLPRDVFPLNREFKKGGLYIAPQGTYSFGSESEGSYSVVDTNYAYEVSGNGKFAYGIEAGWFHSFKNPRLIHFLEAGLAYRVFKGEADHQGLLSTPLSERPFQSDNSFNNQYLVGTFRATNAKQLGKRSFLSTSLGVNFNYLLSEDYRRSAPYPLEDEKFHDASSLQLHLEMGVGFRVSRQLIAMPTIETPLLTAYPTDQLNPAFPFFSTKYQPVIIGIKFFFLREDPENCNAPVFDGPQPAM